MRHRRWWLGLLLVGGVGCHDLPDDQLLTSAHFRYHARADAVLDPTIMDRLETHRAEFDARYGVEPGVVDYYLFRDEADLDANSPCPEHANCTGGRTVFAAAPFHEHELVHAFLADTGEPAIVVAEGFAQYASCLYPRTAVAVVPWTLAFGSRNASGYAYGFGQRLVSWMMATGGPTKVLDYYHRALPTGDAALFAAQFERSWGRRISDVAVELEDDRYGGSSCACAAPALPADGSSSSFVAGQDYRTLETTAESRLELRSDAGQVLFPYDCAGAADLAYALEPTGAATAGPAMTIARVGAGRFGIVSAGWETGTAVVSASQHATSDWTCGTAAANPVPLDRPMTLWATAGSRGPTWFSFTLAGDAVLDTLDAYTDFVICPACPGLLGVAGCVSIGNVSDLSQPIPLKRPPSGQIVVELSSSQLTARGSQAIRLRPAP